MIYKGISLDKDDAYTILAQLSHAADRYKKLMEEAKDAEWRKHAEKMYGRVREVHDALNRECCAAIDRGDFT